MKDKLRGKSGQTLRLSFSNIDYIVNEKEKTVTCNLTYSINLKDLESRGIKFSKNFIKTHINSRFDTIFDVENKREIFNYTKELEYKDFESLPENGEPNVLYKVSNTDNELPHQNYQWRNGQYHILSFIFIDGKYYPVTYGQYAFHDYINVKEISSIAKCSDDDVFDVNIGKRLALSKAKRRAYKEAYGLFSKMYEVYEDILIEIESFKDFLGNKVQDELNHEYKLGHND